MIVTHQKKGASRGALVGALAIGALALGSSAANAYSYRTCNGNPIKWNSNQTTMYISTTSFPPGSGWDVDVQNAMWHWNNVKGSRFLFYYNRDTDGSHNSSNGRNEVYLDNSLGGSTLAVTLTRYHCYWLFGYHYGIDETDMGFNNNVSWNLNPLNYNSLGSPYSYEGVALHELGHVQGLLHSNGGLATMNSYYPNSGTLGHWKEWDPLADDRQGVRAIYHDTTTETDVAASAFKRTGTGTSGLVSSTTSAARGTYVNMDFTFSNQSTSTKTFDIRFYLSTNNYISTGDTLLGTNTGAWGTAGFTGTFSRSLYIPTSLTPGWYYLGFIVDYNNLLAESVESNNYQEMPRQIYIY